MWIGLSRNLVVQQIYITSEEAFDEFLMFVLFCFVFLLALSLKSM